MNPSIAIAVPHQTPGTREQSRPGELSPRCTVIAKLKSKAVLSWKTALSFLILFGLGASPLALSTASAAGPLKKHPTNGRYFTDDSGKAIYLTGSHNWDTFQILAEGAVLAHGPSGRPASFTEYLDVLQSHQHNFTRLWVADTAWSKFTQNFIDPQPYVRTGPGAATGGGQKFDLNQLNQAYFDELRSRVIAARDRGIYVSVMLFDAFGIGEYSDHRDTWPFHPFNTANNINGINGDPNGDGVGLEYHTLQIPAITTLQETYIRKVVDTVNDLDNVLYEIKNEGGASSTDWQYHLINVIKSYEGGKPKRHPVGMTSQTGYGGTNANLFNSPADWISPGGENVGQEAYFSNPPAATGSKVIITDTDHMAPNTTDATWIWRSFLRGLNPIVMDHWNGTQWDPIRRAMGHTRGYADRMNLAAMTPQNGLSNTRYCLANVGSEYLVYQPGNGAFTVRLASGAYSVEWFNPSNGATTQAGAVSGGSNRTFTPPFSGAAVLYLTRAVPEPGRLGFLNALFPQK